MYKRKGLDSKEWFQSYIHIEDTCVPRIKGKPIDKSDIWHCWIWQGGKTNTGAGTCRWNKKQIVAHKVAWLLYRPKQKIPANMYFMHLCGKKLCVNPKHLKLVKKAKLYQRRN